MIRLAYRFFLGCILGPLQSATGDPLDAAASPLASIHRFHEEVVSGNSEQVLQLLRKTPALASQQDELGFTALHAVASEPHLDLAELLLQNGADVHARDRAGATPLHFAAYPSMAAVFLRHGADINARDRNGDTPLHAQSGENGSLAMIMMLLKHGADPQLRNLRGATPIDLCRAAGRAGSSAFDEAKALELFEFFQSDTDRLGGSRTGTP